MIIRCKSSANLLYGEKFARTGRGNPEEYFVSEDVLKRFYLWDIPGTVKFFTEKIRYGAEGEWM